MYVSVPRVRQPPPSCRSVIRSIGNCSELQPKTSSSHLENSATGIWLLEFDTGSFLRNTSPEGMWWSCEDRGFGVDCASCVPPVSRPLVWVRVLRILFTKCHSVLLQSQTPFLSCVSLGNTRIYPFKSGITEPIEARSAATSLQFFCIQCRI